MAPLILLGKQILQDLCRENADWDDPISDQLRPRWEQWRNDLRLLESLKIPRCYKPEEFGDPKVVELHHFSDASQAGYGQCSYLRLLNESDQAHCSLAMGKSRVAPLKSVTIPRLELTAAVVSDRVSQWLVHELDYQDVTEFFWTDSKVVMGYINYVTRRFHVFVVNRVQQIHEHTQAQQWQYIDARSNPADAASRGLTAKQRNLNLKKCSSLYRLDPYLDANDILHMPEVSKHPVILPRRSHVINLILQYCHQATKHQGSGMTHNEVRQRGYWIIGGTSVVANLVSKCVICRKLRAPLVQRKLADTPEDRVEPAPPFTYSAVDYFGPFLLKEGRKEIKRYGVLFTCMASRAIHIETANTLETDSFINALRRFQAERGPIRQLRSDRGTNFVGAQRELQEALSEMDEDKVRNTLLEENCE